MHRNKKILLTYIELELNQGSKTMRKHNNTMRNNKTSSLSVLFTFTKNFITDCTESIFNSMMKIENDFYLKRAIPNGLMPYYSNKNIEFLKFVFIYFIVL